MEQGKPSHVLAKYVSDLLVLELHVRMAFDMQRWDRDFTKLDRASQLVSRLTRASDNRIHVLERCLAGLGGREGPDVKTSFTDIVGFLAGAIDKTRKTKVSKGLSDDYASLALCAAGYAALITTANAMGQSSIASSAEQLLEGCSGLMTDVARALPQIVVQELALFGLSALPSAAHVSTQQIERAWQTHRQQERSSHATTEIGSAGTRTSSVAISFSPTQR
jgi:hypothetical protein